GFWVGLLDGAIPPATARHNLIQRPGSAPVFGTPYIDERRIPCQIGFSGGGGFSNSEEAWAALLRAIQPTNPTPRELRAEREDGTIVALEAVIELPPGFNTEVNIIHATFITVDLEWL